jgi:hypothetical protein
MRDSKGRFTSGNAYATLGGRARAAKLSRRRRRAIARKGYRAMVRKHFLGDFRAQRAYWAALGVWNSEKVFIGTPVPVRATDPGKPQDFLARYWQLELMNGAHLDVSFMAGR